VTDHAASSAKLAGPRSTAENFFDMFPAEVPPTALRSILPDSLRYACVCTSHRVGDLSPQRARRIRTLQLDLGIGDQRLMPLAKFVIVHHDTINTLELVHYVRKLVDVAL